MEEVRKASTVLLCFVNGVSCKHDLFHVRLHRVLEEYLQDVLNILYFKRQLNF